MTGATDLERAIGILGDLVAFPTVSSDTNLGMVDHCRKTLESHGARCEITRDASGKKANLFATIGPDTDGGVILSGHSDVVPADERDWTADPFTLTRRGDRLHGRGACDMKGFVACVLSMAGRFASADLSRPVHVALTHDEEVGCRGAPALLDALRRSGRKPSACIVGEPTEMSVVIGHKGMCEYTTHFAGLAGHGSDPDRGVNAVEYAVLHASHLLVLAGALRDRAPARSPFSPPHTTLQVGKIQGGEAHNVIPERCEVHWEMRPVSEEDRLFAREAVDELIMETLLPEMRTRHPGADVAIDVLGEVAGLVPDKKSAACRLALKLTGTDSTGTVPFGTEAGLFQRAGIPAVLCGPGSITQAHKPDEHITVGELEGCLAMLDRLADELERGS